MPPVTARDVPRTSEVTDATQPTSISLKPLPTGPLLRWKACSLSVRPLTPDAGIYLASTVTGPSAGLWGRTRGRTLPVPVTCLLQVLLFSNLTHELTALQWPGIWDPGWHGGSAEKQCSFWAMFFCSPILELGLWHLLDKKVQTFERSPFHILKLAHHKTHYFQVFNLMNFLICI